ncbi:hypothetical protein DZF91_18745 [Actinomadura logoneensis]|uniref:Uncharacterized protein n=1 Tax=Actinomadura logoneensis TaxID=2293572 RepID=A0A372JJC8_9ACTN|nr:hypothetical protein [Actinomadura logoneensis]RFU40122.1 hypothetical protein DZF91_18745 [Actinomadura logoneensis]
MRCPACGSDTTPALPRCTRCDAPLNSGARPSGDAATRDDGWPSSPRWPSEPDAPATQADAPGRPGSGLAPGPYPFASSAGHEATYPGDYPPPPSDRDPGTPPHEFGHASSGAAAESGGGVGGEAEHVPTESDAGYASHRSEADSGYSAPQTELDAGYASPPTVYDPGTPSPSADPGAAYGPPPEPWAGAGGAGLSATPPPPPGSPGEHTITLSPEPWADEPQVWSPPPPPERRKSPPYLLIVTGLVVLAAVALGIVFWPHGSGKAGRTGSDTAATTQAAGPGTTGQPSETASSPSETPSSPSPSGDMTEQAGKVNALLDDMASTRGRLQSVLTDDCQTSGLQQIKGERETQLATAQALDVSAIDNGQQLKDSLVRALQASVASNARYIELSPGCPPDSDVVDVNEQATAAKREFIGYWNAVARKADLSPRTEASI